MSTETLSHLKSRLTDVHNLHMAGALLDWDQQTYMPPGGVGARAEQKATISRLAHDLFVAEETGKLLRESERNGVPPGGDDAALLRVVRRDFDKATRIPASLVAEMARVTALAQEEWQKARAANDYAAFAPWLERLLDLQRRTADALGWKHRLYDALLDQYEPGTTSAHVDAVFAGLKEATVPLVRAIAEKGEVVDPSVLHREYDEEKQKEFAEAILAELGYEFRCGRQDRSAHPFCTNFSQNDVRITTRYCRTFLSSALFGSLHEMGHALYEQGVSPALEGTMLSGGTSLAVHESQSRLWENLVGRSRPFWREYYPRLQETFPEQTAGVTLEQFYRAMNCVRPSLIRVEADEVTYNLHIILRYEMENDLLEGRLSVRDAPEAWNARMEELLGVRPETDADGILQDVHWSIGIMGYFPTYTLGNVLSVQLFEAALARDAAVGEGIERGDFGPLLSWLRENVHQYGRKLYPNELIERAAGSPLTIEPYVGYLRRKFGEIYGLA